MNKESLVSAVAAQFEGATKKDVKVIVDEVFEQIKIAVASGDQVKISGFGTFALAERASRVARNPRTGVEMNIPPFKAPKFKVSKNFKDFVNE
jgi:DNA-binding protein HU-beta